MEIRLFEIEDRAEVVALWNEVFPDLTEHNDPNGSIDRKVAIDDNLFFVALIDGAVVGTIMAGYDGHRSWIYSLAVAADCRRQQIGTQLVRAAEEALKEFKCPKVNLQVRTDNANVISFYESLGYSTEPRISLGKILYRD